jgi:hypothetical protein
VWPKSRLAELSKAWQVFSAEVRDELAECRADRKALWDNNRALWDEIRELKAK